MEWWEYWTVIDKKNCIAFERNNQEIVLYVDADVKIYTFNSDISANINQSINQSISYMYRNSILEKKSCFFINFR